jgi:hypothetical protein
MRTIWLFGKSRDLQNVIQMVGIAITAIFIGMVCMFVTSCAEKVEDTAPPKVATTEQVSETPKEGDVRQQAPVLDQFAEDEIDPEMLCPTDVAYDPDEYDECVFSSPEIGANPYYKVDVSIPEAFKNAVIGKSFNEGFGIQCVAGFKEFQYSISGKIIATSTGGASGYAKQQEQFGAISMRWHAGANGLQDGDWIIFGSGAYGHVAMYINEQILGQNQSGGDIYAGSPFSIKPLSTGGQILGYYRWDEWNKPVPQPEPEPAPTPQPDKCAVWHLQRGDTLGNIQLECEGHIDWSHIGEYAATWQQENGQTVYEGWQSPSHVGLHAGQDITKQ